LRKTKLRARANLPNLNFLRDKIDLSITPIFSARMGIPPQTFSEFRGLARHLLTHHDRGLHTEFIRTSGKPESLSAFPKAIFHHHTLPRGQVRAVPRYAKLIDLHPMIMVTARGAG